MKFKELKIMEEAELKDKLNDLNNELMKQNAQIATGTTPKSPGQVKQIKKTIAKILTLLNKEKKGKTNNE